MVDAGGFENLVNYSLLILIDFSLKTKTQKQHLKITNYLIQSC